MIGQSQITIERFQRPPAMRRRGAHVIRARLLAMLFASTASDAWSACGVNAQGVNFGSYDPFGRSSLDGAGNIAVTCDLGVAYAIALSSGAGTYAARVMANGPFLLRYNLYTDASRILVWGDGNGATLTVGGGGTATVANVAIYGRIPASQNAHVGNYFDSVVVTVTF